MEQKHGDHYPKNTNADRLWPLAPEFGTAMGAGIGAAIGSFGAGLAGGVGVGVVAGLVLYLGFNSDSRGDGCSQRGGPFRASIEGPPEARATRSRDVGGRQPRRG
jgi:hypothetical protein